MTLGFSLECLGRDAFLDELYVTPEGCGMGLGKRARQVVEDTCRELGVNVVHLAVERNRVNTRRFYENAGFEPDERYLMTKWYSRK